MSLSLESESDQASWSELLQPLLQEHFQFSQFRKGQLDILSSVLAGRDALAVMPTGGGKSLCYQLPALYRSGTVVVISPLISLMKDQVRSLQTRGIPAGCLHTGQGLEEKRTVFSELRRHPRFLLYVSPERVQKPGFAAWIREEKLSLFAIDEAHCVSQWGPEFRQDYHRLNLLRELRPEVPILALTATATPQVLRDITKQLGLRTPDRHVYGFYRPNLYYQVEACENETSKRSWLVQALRQNLEGRILVYCGTRKQCEELTELLAIGHAGVDFYHAGLETGQRHRIQNDFESGRTRILVATNAFGMGIDQPDVRLVVHYQLPANIESYYQEIGRAGRDGREATCLLLYAKRDKGLHAYFIQKSEAEARHIQQRWKALETITEFAESGECRHAGILTYFRDHVRIGACGHCDVCAPESPRRVLKPTETGGAEPKVGRGKQGKVLHNGPLSPEAEARYLSLKAWRREFARSQDVPAFLVFGDKTLRELAAKNPQNRSELERIYGLGQRKVEQFGEELLSQLTKFP